MSNSTKKETGSDEARLVAALKAGDETAFQTLMASHKEQVYATAYGFTLDEEESLDIVQNVFMKAFQGMGRFKAESKISTWLFRITVNECLNLRRKWSRRLRRFHQPMDAPGIPLVLKSNTKGPDELLIVKEMGEKLKQALAALPDQARMVFVLKEIQGHSYEEIAGLLKIKKGTVSSRLHYARKKLQKALAPYIGGESP